MQLRIAARSVWMWLARAVAVLAILAAVTFIAYRGLHVNATTAGFTYLVAVLLIAAFLGATEAILASLMAAACFNFFFLPPILTFSVADPQNWVALCALLVTAIVASRLAARARDQTREALARQQEMELLYALSRSILLSDPGDTMARRITLDLARIFDFSTVVLFDARTGVAYNAGPEDPLVTSQSLDHNMREAAVSGTSFDDPSGLRIFAVRLGGQPIGSLGLRPSRVSETALQSLANLVAITLEKVRAQEEANRVEVERQSETLKATMLDAIAHEFKTPLTSIKAAASMLAFNPPSSPEKIREFGAIVNEESDRLERLVTEAIQMARIDGGKLKMDRRLSNSSEIIQRVIDQSRAALGGRRVSVTIEPDAEQLFADPELIELALRHLVDNAAKYSGGSGGIAIHVADRERADSGRGEARGVLIEVSDLGPGIPETEQDRIFDKFYRASQTSGVAPGTGMGLNIVREIVRAHGGQVWVESRPGEGARFSIVLPPWHAEAAV